LVPHLKTPVLKTVNFTKIMVELKYPRFVLAKVLVIVETVGEIGDKLR